MFNEETSVLPHFETAHAENLVRELFYLFEENGWWHKNKEEYCRMMLLTQEERDAEIEASRENMDKTMAESEREIGNLSWFSELDEFGLFGHKRIARNDVIVHAFLVSYPETGRSHDPNFYVVYRPGDEDDYSKVYVVCRKQISGYVSYKWVCEPIQEMYYAHQQFMKQYGGRPYG